MSYELGLSANRNSKLNTHNLQNLVVDCAHAGIDLVPGRLAQHLGMASRAQAARTPRGHPATR